MTLATLPRAAADALALLDTAEPQWRRMDTDSLAAELEMATIMPGNSRADYVRAAAIALHLAGRAG